MKKHLRAASINFYAASLLFISMSPLTTGRAKDEKTCSVALGADKEDSPDAIHLHPPMSGWRIIVRRDGSGTMEYGSSASDFASFPPSTIDFNSLLHAAKTSKVVPGKDPSSIKVSIKYPIQHAMVAESRAMATEWEELCKKIQAGLSAQSPKRVEKLLAKHPIAKNLPVPKIKQQDPRPVEKAGPSPAEKEKN